MKEEEPRTARRGHQIQNPEGWDEQAAMKPGNGAQLVFQMYLKVTPENEGAFGVRETLGVLLHSGDF